MIASQKAIEACLEKVKAKANQQKTKTGLEEMETAVETVLEEMKAKFSSKKSLTKGTPV